MFLIVVPNYRNDVSNTVGFQYREITDKRN